MNARFLFIFFLIPLITSAQTYEFTKTAGGNNADNINDGCIDPFGNIYFAGQYQDSIDFKKDYGGGDIKKTTFTSDAFVMKINADKSYGWTRTIPNDQDRSYIVSDLQGNVYLVGAFEGLVNFGADFGISDARGSHAFFYDIYLVKINADGSYGGVKVIGGNYQEYVNDLAVDKFGNIYLGGSFANNSIDFAADFGTSDIKTNSNNNYKGFITKINADYTYGWTKVFDGNNTAIEGISLDSSGNIFVTGEFENQVNFKTDFGGTEIKTSEGGLDVFVTKINANASYGWTYSFGGSYYDFGFGMINDQNNNLYVTGQFKGNVNFKKDASGMDIKYAGLGFGAYVLKFDSNGNCLYSRVMQAYGQYGVIGGGGTALKIDTCGNVFLYGGIAGDVDFGADFGATDFKSNIGAFYTKFYPDGSYGYTKILKGQTNASDCILLDKNDNIILGGAFHQSADFGADFGTTDERTIILNRNNANYLFFTFINLNDRLSNSKLLPPDFSYCETIPDTIINSIGNWQSYLWSTGNTNANLDINQSGNYWLKVKNGNCYLSDTIHVTKNPIPNYLLTSESIYYPTGSIAVNNHDTIHIQPKSNNSISVEIKINDTSSTDHYYWYNNNQLISEQATISYDFFLVQEMDFKSKVVSHNGCYAEKEVSIVVAPLLFIPNLVTPNSDGKNDMFEIFYNGNTDYNLSIYNRWGDKVFLSTDRFQYWQGSSESEGIYYYHLSTGSKEYKGWVQLVR